MVEDKTYQIYSINCPIDTEKVRYIGVTKKMLRQRLREHLLDKSRTHKTTWIKSLIKKSLLPTIELIEDNLTQQEAFEKEIQYIKLFKACGAPLTNSTIGGEGLSGHNFSYEHRQKLSKAHIGMRGYWYGKKRPQETNKKIAKKLTGTTLSEETRIKISDALKGIKKKPFTKAHRKNLSISLSGRKMKPLSSEHKAKISLAKKGQIPWHKGRTNVYSQATIERMRQSQLRKVGGLKFFTEN